MRTANEIACDGLSMYPIDIDNIQFSGKRVKELIKNAMKDTVLECAKRVKLKYDEKAADGSTIDKESILSLINEIK